MGEQKERNIMNSFMLKKQNLTLATEERRTCNLESRTGGRGGWHELERERRSEKCGEVLGSGSVPKVEGKYCIGSVWERQDSRTMPVFILSMCSNRDTTDQISYMSESVSNLAFYLYLPEQWIPYRRGLLNLNDQKNAAINTCTYALMPTFNYPTSL